MIKNTLSLYFYSYIWALIYKSNQTNYMDYNVIYDFCKVRNLGNAMSNGTKEYPPRVKFILSLLDKLNIKYEIDTFNRKGSNLHNIYLRGTTNKWVMAHHDVCNHTTDNANDNSASVINAIGLKTLRPDINIALVDGEEPPCMGAGSKHFAQRVLNKTLDVEWVLNLELTGSGGTNFFIGDYGTGLTNKIKEKFDCPLHHPPFNDATMLIQTAQINAALINPLPLKSDEFVIDQVGVANDLLNTRKPKKNNWRDWLFGSDSDGGVDEFVSGFDNLTEEEYQNLTDEEIMDIEEQDELNYDKFIDDIEEINNRSGDEVDTEVEEDGFNYGNWDFGIKNLRKGMSLTQHQRDSVIRELKLLKYSPKDESQKLVMNKRPIVVPPGGIAKLNQMDLSVLYRCHGPDDTVEHIRPNEMKDFVEKVLTVICEL